MSTLDYEKIWPVLIGEQFHYVGGAGLPGSNTIPEDWTIASGAWSGYSERYIEVTSPGELVYSGDSPNSISGFHDTNGFANYAYVLRVYGYENMKFELRCRRFDHNDYLAISIDAEANTVELLENAGGEIRSAAKSSHTFKTDAYYSIELWCIDNDMFGYISGSEILSGIVCNQETSDGMSIYVPEINNDDPVHFAKAAVHDLVSWNTPNVANEDPSDLLLQYRKIMKQRIENPDARNYDTYKYADNFFKFNSNVGKTNDTWEILGYPIKEPHTEDYFEPTTVITPPTSCPP